VNKVFSHSLNEKQFEV